MNNLLNYFDEDTFKTLKSNPDLYQKCHHLVSVLFRDKKDKGGFPYLGHLERVSEKMTTLNGKVLGLLHDTVEDIPLVTFEDLIDFGVPLEVIEALKLVTHEDHPKGLSKEEKLKNYNAEIDKIISSGNNLAIELKIADMSDNFDPVRLSSCSVEQQQWFQEKYAPQLIKLKKCWEGVHDAR